MRSDKIRENIDPKPFVRIGERGTYCLMAWAGPCYDRWSTMYANNHDCKMGADHKSRHQCSCGVSRMKQPDDPEWGDE